MVELNPNLHYLSTFDGERPDLFPEDEQAVLDDVNRRVAAKASLGELMEFLFGAIQALYPCDRIGVAFVEDGGRRRRSRRPPTCGTSRASWGRTSRSSAAARGCAGRWRPGWCWAGRS